MEWLLIIVKAITLGVGFINTPKIIAITIRACNGDSIDSSDASDINRWSLMWTLFYLAHLL